MFQQHARVFHGRKLRQKQTKNGPKWEKKTKTALEKMSTADRERHTSRQKKTSRNRETEKGEEGETGRQTNRGKEEDTSRIQSNDRLGALAAKLLLLVGRLTSQQHVSVSQGRICSDNFTCCHTETEVAGQTFYLTQSRFSDTGADQSQR